MGHPVLIFFGTVGHRGRPGSHAQQQFSASSPPADRPSSRREVTGAPRGFHRGRGAPFRARVARLPVFFGEVPLPFLCLLLNQIIGEFLLFVFCLFAVEPCGPLTCVGGEPLIAGWLANVVSPSAGGLRLRAGPSACSRCPCDGARVDGRLRRPALAFLTLPLVARPSPWS